MELRRLTFERRGVVFFFFFEIPGHRFFESFVKVGFGLVAELRAGARDVRQRVLDVALPGWAIDWFSGEANLAGDGGVDLVEGVAFSRADVEDTAGGDLAGSQTSQEVGADGVVDVVEVAAGETIAEDGWGLACHHLEGELCDD